MMKTTLLALFLITTPIFSKIEVQQWEPEPITIEIDGKTYYYYPPIEVNGEGEEL
jgi:hypothetical protein